MPKEPSVDNHITADPEPTAVVAALEPGIDVYRYQAQLIDLRRQLVEPELGKASLERRLEHVHRAIREDKRSREELVVSLNTRWSEEAGREIRDEVASGLKSVGRLETRLEENDRTASVLEEGIRRLERHLRELRRNEAVLLEQIEHSVKAFGDAVSIVNILREVEDAVPRHPGGELETYEAVQRNAAPARSEIEDLKMKVAQQHRLIELLLGAEEASLVAVLGGEDARVVAARKLKTLLLTE